MVDAPWAQPPLRDLEPAALAEEDVRGRHSDILEDDLGMAVRRVVIAEHAQGPDDRDARRIHRHEDHGLTLVRRRLGISEPHENGELAALIHGAGGPPFAAVDEIVVAIASDLRAD